MRIDELHRWSSNNDVDKVTVAREVMYKFGVKPGDMAMDVPRLPKLPPIDTLGKTPDNSDDNGKERGGLLKTLNIQYRGRENETRGADDMGRKDGGDTKQRDEAETNKILDEFQKVSVYEFE